jgi:hypothetical protein
MGGDPPGSAALLLFLVFKELCNIYLYYWNTIPENHPFGASAGSREAVDRYGKYVFHHQS